MGSGARFGVVLHREAFLPLDPHAGQGLVVQVHMCHLDSSVSFHVFPIDDKAVILGGYFAFARQQVLDRVIDPSVTVVHLVGSHSL